MVQGHDRKSDTYSNGEDPSGRFNERGVFLMIQAECLESALKTVNEVKRQCDHADHVDDYDPEFLEGDIDAAVNVFDGFIVARIVDHAE